MDRRNPGSRDLVSPPGGTGGGRLRRSSYPGVRPSPGIRPPEPADPPQKLRLPPDNFPPGSADYWRRTAFQSFGPGPLAATELFQLRAPDRAHAVCRDLTLGVENLLASDLITFRVLVDGAPVPGWEVPIVPANVSTLRVGFGAAFTRIWIPGGSTFSVTVERTDVGTNDVSAEAGGWWYPADIQRDFYGDV